METIETAKVTFTPVGTMNEFGMNDLAHMKVGTILEGMIVIRHEGADTEYYEGQIEVQDEGVLFVEHE